MAWANWACRFLNWWANPVMLLCVSLWAVGCMPLDHCWTKSLAAISSGVCPSGCSWVSCTGSLGCGGGCGYCCWAWRSASSFSALCFSSFSFRTSILREAIQMRKCSNSFSLSLSVSDSVVLEGLWYLIFCSGWGLGGSRLFAEELPHLVVEISTRIWLQQLHWKSRIRMDFPFTVASLEAVLGP